MIKLHHPGEPNCFLHIYFIWVEISVNTKIPVLHVLCGVVLLGQVITLSLPTEVEFELGCDNIM